MGGGCAHDTICQVTCIAPLPPSLNFTVNIGIYDQIPTEVCNAQRVLHWEVRTINGVAGGTLHLTPIEIMSSWTRKQILLPDAPTVCCLCVEIH